MRLVLLFAACLAACNGDKADSLEDDDDGGSDDGTDCTDCDGDGFDALSAGGDDCDDSDPSVHPAADETWYDGVDQDCDGSSDYDADRDGHDHDAHGGGDCDDDDPLTNPGALELCASGADEDCDGSSDESGCGWATDHAAGLWYDPSLEFLGQAIATDCDLDGDGVLEVLATAPGELAEDVPGVVLTAARGGELMPAEGLRIESDDPSAGFGTYLDCHGDLNGDGYADLAVTAFDEGEDSINLGVTRLFLGPIGGRLEVDSADFVWTGDRDGYKNLGMVVGIVSDSKAGADLVHGMGDSFSAWDGDAGEVYESGVVVVVRHPLSDDVFSGWDEDRIRIRGEGHGEFDIADLDGDGINDIARPDFSVEDGVKRCGAVYSGEDIAAAPSKVFFEASTDAMAVLGCTAFDAPDSTSGWNVASDTDLDGDGHNDVFVSLSDGFAAFRGGSGSWAGVLETEAHVEADFCGGRGVRDADFTRADNGDLVWAVSMVRAPDCDAYNSNFSGRVAIFRGWEWAALSFDDAWTWVANDMDEYGFDSYQLASRPIRFSHDGETRLWWGDPAWTESSEPPTNFGRLHAWDLATFEATP